MTYLEGGLPSGADFRAGRPNGTWGPLGGGEEGRMKNMHPSCGLGLGAQCGQDARQPRGTEVAWGLGCGTAPWGMDVQKVGSSDEEVRSFEYALLLFLI